MIEKYMLKRYKEWLIKIHGSTYNEITASTEKIREAGGSYCYVNKDCFDGYYLPPFFLKFHILNSVLGYYTHAANREWKRKASQHLSYIIHLISDKLENYWVQKNNLIKSGAKYYLKLLWPYKDDLDFLKEQGKYEYILMETYRNEDIGFEEKLRKKVGKLKRIWYDLTLTAY